jgi:fused signal recognition particle receptor
MQAMSDERPRQGFLARIRGGIRKTQERLGAGLQRVFGVGAVLDAATLAGLEEALLSADVGPAVASRLVARVKRAATDGDGEAAKRALVDEIVAILAEPRRTTPWFCRSAAGPVVWLVVGVNGSGKTTTLGKLAARAHGEGLSTMVVAGDTFRAAAGEQLELWSRRAGAQFFASREGADPAAVVFDGLEAAKARGLDLVLVDTAGRLHTKTHLMQELEKVKRVAGKALAGAPHEVLLVLDGTTGRNAFQQAQEFSDRLGVTGIVITKVDGTAKGGAVLAVAEELRLPVAFLGVGEGQDDLVPFDAREFATALIEA